MQLVLCGSYGATNELSFGDYSGYSIRKYIDSNKNLVSIIQKIKYGSGSYNIYPSLTDINDSIISANCFTPEFTDPDTKQKCFAAYRHIKLIDKDSKTKLYAIMIVINSEIALKTYNIQSKYLNQSTVLIKNDGTYIIKNNDFRNANFFDYVVNYNGLTLDWKSQLEKQLKTEFDNTSVIDLFYKNHRGWDCVFSLIKLDNGWYSITCVPLSSFNLINEDINYSLIILLLFLSLFIVDAVVVYFIGKVMNENKKTAEMATKEATSANLAKSRFLSTMSHELRTPLNAIIGFVSLAQDITDDPVQLKDYLGKITISSKLLLQLISDILDISAIETNKMKINFGEFDINKLITALSEIFYDQCVKKSIEFNVILKNIHSETLIGDSTRVNQVLLNFLSNAVKFTPSGGKITLVITAINREEKSVIIKFAISDTGCGVSEELKKRLFNPFERDIGDKAIRYSGTGLGLSIAKNITELMGGKVGMESKEGQGSTFWAEIPFVLSEKVRLQEFSPIKGVTVFAAINNIDEREYIGQIFSKIGVNFLLFEDAESLINELDNEKNWTDEKQLCMIDWKLKDLNAIDCTKTIRKKYSPDKLKIVILAYDLTDVKSMCLKAGATYILGKPVFASNIYNYLQEMTNKNVFKSIEPTENHNLDGHKILLIEDNLLNIEIALHMLANFKLEVETAKNGKDGYEKFINSDKDYYSLILMDVQMPIWNGYEATKAIRESSHPNAKIIPILAMTADAFSEDVEKAVKAGMNEHISKPIEPNTLYKVLKKYLH